MFFNFLPSLEKHEVIIYNTSGEKINGEFITDNENIFEIHYKTKEGNKIAYSYKSIIQLINNFSFVSKELYLKTELNTFKLIVKKIFKI